MDREQRKTRLRDTLKKQARRKLGSHLRVAEPAVGELIAGNKVLSKSMGLKVDYKPKPTATDSQRLHADGPHQYSMGQTGSSQVPHAGQQAGSAPYLLPSPEASSKHGEVPFRFRLLDYKISGHIPLGELADYLAQQARNKQAAHAYPKDGSLASGLSGYHSVQAGSAYHSMGTPQQVSKPHQQRTDPPNEKGSLFPEYRRPAQVLSTVEPQRQRSSSRFLEQRTSHASSASAPHRPEIPSSPPPPYEREKGDK